MEPENRIAEASLSEPRQRPSRAPWRRAVGASKDKRELLLVADEILRVRETRAELEMNHHGHISQGPAFRIAPAAHPISNPA